MAVQDRAKSTASSVSLSKRSFRAVSKYDSSAWCPCWELGFWSWKRRETLGCLASSAMAAGSRGRRWRRCCRGSWAAAGRAAGPRRCASVSGAFSTGPPHGSWFGRRTSRYQPAPRHRRRARSRSHPRACRRSHGRHCGPDSRYGGPARRGLWRRMQPLETLGGLQERASGQLGDGRRRKSCVERGGAQLVLMSCRVGWGEVSGSAPASMDGTIIIHHTPTDHKSDRRFGAVVGRLATGWGPGMDGSRAPAVAGGQ